MDVETYARRYTGPFARMAAQMGVPREDLVNAAVVRLLECRRKHGNPPEHTEKAYMRGAILMEIRFWRYGKHHRRRLLATVLEDHAIVAPGCREPVSILELGVPYHAARVVKKRKRRAAAAL